MRILIISYFYNPEPNDIKIHILGRELVRRGHEVTSIVSFPSYPQGKIYDGYRQRLWQREDKDGVNVIRVPLFIDHSRSGLRRAISYLSFMASAAMLGPYLSGPVDAMYVYQPPLTTGVAGWWISRLKRVPFIYEIQDMWPDTLTATGMLSNPLALDILGEIALKLYQRAAALTVNSPGFERNLIAKGADPARIHVIPNWVDEDVYRPQTRDPELGTQYGLDGKFNVIFGGNMGLAQSLHTVIEAARCLSDRPEIQFVLIGDGVERPALEAAAQGLNNIRFIEYQPVDRMPAFFAWGDALLISLKDDPLFAMTIPAKTQAYLACGRPIICAVPGAGAEVIRKSGAGLTCPPEDAAALVSAVDALYTMPRSDREAMGAAGYTYFSEHFKLASLVDRYESLLQSIGR